MPADDVLAFEYGVVQPRLGGRRALAGEEAAFIDSAHSRLIPGHEQRPARHSLVRRFVSLSSRVFCRPAERSAASLAAIASARGHGHRGIEDNGVGRKRVDQRLPSTASGYLFINGRQRDA